MIQHLLPVSQQTITIETPAAYRSKYGSFILLDEYIIQYTDFDMIVITKDKASAFEAAIDHAVRGERVDVEKAVRDVRTTMKAVELILSIAA